MEAQEFSPIPQAETDAFPRTPEDEIKHLRGLVEGKEIQVNPISDVGYIAFNTQRPYIAEAALALLDWDDTAAQTSKDKKRCWDELEALGIDPEVIKHCDKISRVLVGDEEPTYEPELEMRLLSYVKSFSGEHPIPLTSELKNSLHDLRQELIKQRSLEEQAVDPDIHDLYKRTRFTSTLYPDTLATIHTLRGLEERPFNVGILTYGDPSFQFEKVKDILDGEDVGLVLLTKVRKGKFFKEFLKSNPLKDAPIQYTYAETPRNVGVDYAGWKIPIVLFDDDPKQVQSFRSIAESEKIHALGVARVRRQGVKRADAETEIGRMVSEINPSDSYLDTELFKESFWELTVRGMEDWIEDQVIPQLSHDSGVLNKEVQDIIRNIAAIRNKDYSKYISEILIRAGYDSGSYEENTTLWFNPQTQQRITARTTKREEENLS